MEHFFFLARPSTNASPPQSSPPESESDLLSNTPAVDTDLPPLNAAAAAAVKPTRSSSRASTVSRMPVLARPSSSGVPAHASSSSSAIRNPTTTFLLPTPPKPTVSSTGAAFLTPVPSKPTVSSTAASVLLPAPAKPTSAPAKPAPAPTKLTTAPAKPTPAPPSPALDPTPPSTPTPPPHPRITVKLTLPSARITKTSDLVLTLTATLTTPTSTPLSLHRHATIFDPSTSPLSHWGLADRSRRPLRIPAKRPKPIAPPTGGLIDFAQDMITLEPGVPAESQVVVPAEALVALEKGKSYMVYSRADRERKKPAQVRGRWGRREEVAESAFWCEAVEEEEEDEDGADERERWEKVDVSWVLRDRDWIEVEVVVANSVKFVVV